MHDSELDHYEEQEKQSMAKDEASVDIKEAISKAVKEFKWIHDVAGLNYEDLCIHQNQDLPEWFNIPTFDTFEGVENPMDLLRSYCIHLVMVGIDESLVMQNVSGSLLDEALE